MSKQGSSDEQNAQKIIDFLGSNFPEDAALMNEVIVVNYVNIINHGANLHGLDQVQLLAIGAIIHKLFENLLRKSVDKPIEAVQNDLFDGKSMDYDDILNAFLDQKKIDELEETEEEDDDDDLEGEDWKGK